MEEERKVYKDFVGEPEGKRPLGTPRCRWENTTKMYLRDLRECGMDLPGSGQDQCQVLVNTVLNLQVLAPQI
jgi:hypothetical protein